MNNYKIIYNQDYLAHAEKKSKSKYKGGFEVQTGSITHGTNMNNELYHHGVKGQKWGIRRYQNPDGTLTPEGRKRLTKIANKRSPVAISKLEKEESVINEAYSTLPSLLKMLAAEQYMYNQIDKERHKAVNGSIPTDKKSKELKKREKIALDAQKEYFKELEKSAELLTDDQYSKYKDAGKRNVIQAIKNAKGLHNEFMRLEDEFYLDLGMTEKRYAKPGYSDSVLKEIMNDPYKHAGAQRKIKDSDDYRQSILEDRYGKYGKYHDKYVKISDYKNKVSPKDYEQLKNPEFWNNPYADEILWLMQEEYKSK